MLFRSVTDIDNGQLLIRYKNGKIASLSSSELFSTDYALVSTTYGAQGKSADRMIGALDRYVGRESFYVTVSRVKHSLKLFVSEDLGQLIDLAKKLKVKENPIDALSQFRKQHVVIAQCMNNQLTNSQVISKVNRLQEVDGVPNLER